MQKRRVQQVEFVALMASLMAIVALAIDAVLPALDIIGLSVGVTDPVVTQQIIIMIFLGLGIGPLLFGPISDSMGRKPIVYMGLGLFIFASFICVFAKSFELMLLGRVLQGISLSAPRTISIAMVRDTYEGDFMARIMSFITVVFLFIPIIAPALGKWILDAHSWQAIFYMQLFFTLIVGLWFWRRQPETLSATHRIPFSIHIFKDGFVELIKYKQTMGLTLISGFIVGSFLVYLSSAQQIFQTQFNLKDEFPYIFASLAISISIATFLNGTMVLRYGMEKIITVSLVGYASISILYVALFYNTGNPSVGVVVGFFALQFFAIGFLFGNLRAMAMQPIGHIAGIGAAITGFIGTLMSVPISTFIGTFIKDTALPLFIGFSVCSLASILVLFYLKGLKKRELLQRA